MRIMIKNKLTKLRQIVVILAVCIVTLSPLQALARENATYDPTFFGKNDILLYSPVDVGCTSNGGTSSAVSGEDNRHKTWNYLIERGLSAEQAAGVLGNIQSVSGGIFSPTFNEIGKDFDAPVTTDSPDIDDNGGYGIAQWKGQERKSLVSALKSAQPDLMKKYYTVDYSSPGSYTGEKDGYVPKNITTGELMPVDDNDKLLLAELKVLVDGMSSRTLHDPAVKKGYGDANDKEWAVIQRQKTVADTSNVWVYSFEIPKDNIDSVATVRALNGEALFKLYSGDDASGLCSGGSKQQLAQEILDTNNLYYDYGMPAVEKNIIPSIASGENNGNDWPCGMNMKFLQGLAAITKEHRIRANSLSRACSGDLPQGSGAQSRHYAGNGSAVDFGPIDNLSSYSLEGANLILSYIGPFLVDNSTVGQVVGSPTSQTSGFCLPNLDLPSGINIRRIGDYCHHLHVDVPPNADPNLQCKSPIFFGGCDEKNRV